jgi:hypothetical protein
MPIMPPSGSITGAPLIPRSDSRAANFLNRHFWIYGDYIGRHHICRTHVYLPLLILCGYSPRSGAGRPLRFHRNVALIADQEPTTVTPRLPSRPGQPLLRNGLRQTRPRKQRASSAVSSALILCVAVGLAAFPLTLLAWLARRSGLTGCEIAPPAGGALSHPIEIRRG